MIIKLIATLVAITLIILITGLYPTAALVVMGLGLTFLYLFFKDVS